jgi:hypothetical protein
MTETTKGLLVSSYPAQWEDIVKRWQTDGPGCGYFPPPQTRARMEDVVNELDAIIEHAARPRGYLEMRHGNGCGDQGHASAVKESNKLVAKIRKALGFVQPKKDLRF